MAFFLTAPVDPGTGTPPGSTAAWADGAALFGAFVILAAGNDVLVAPATAKVTDTGVVVSDSSIILVSFRGGAIDATATSITAVNAGGPTSITVTVGPTPTGNILYSWAIIGPTP
jgi:hypothetical protein